MPGSGPTLRQRELGKRLRELRKALGLTVEEVGAELLCSPTKISRIETAARRPTLRDVRDLCRLYKVDKATTNEFMQLTREAREQGWWRQYSDLNLDPYIGLEEAATSITSYTMYYVPALLQIEDYTRAIIKGIAPKIDLKVHQERVEARLRRQEILDREPPPNYRVLMDEAVLRRPVGGTTVMIAQLDKILWAGENRKATVQVIPFGIGAHAAQDSNFILFEFAEQQQPPVVFVEGLIKHQYQERETDVARYREAIELLRDEALSPRASMQLVAEVKDSYVVKLDAA